MKSSTAVGEYEFLDRETLDALDWFSSCVAAQLREVEKKCASLDKSSTGWHAAARQCQADVLYASELYSTLLERYQVTIGFEKIANVHVETFVPRQAVEEKRLKRVLINFHGGQFKFGAGTASHLESLPMAATAGTKVISVDYRLAPEHCFPAASDDAFSVFTSLLRTYPPQDIAVFGSSAGALLVAQLIARLWLAGLPMPGAAGMFFGGAHYWRSGDSGRFADWDPERPVPSAKSEPYFECVDFNDPLAFPGQSPEILKSFPPSMLISSTRDFALSSVVHTHNQLTKQGVDSVLHVWEGLPHTFMYNPRLPASRLAWQVAARFFDQRLCTP